MVQIRYLSAIFHQKVSANIHDGTTQSLPFHGPNQCGTDCQLSKSHPLFPAAGHVAIQPHCISQLSHHLNVPRQISNLEEGDNWHLPLLSRPTKSSSHAPPGHYPVLWAGMGTVAMFPLKMAEQPKAEALNDSVELSPLESEYTSWTVIREKINFLLCCVHYILDLFVSKI